VELEIAQVSHLFATPTDADHHGLEKAAGTCQVDVACRASTDTALARVAKSVARMSFSDSFGSTYLCTGTLLNPIGGSSTPYFYSANHCIDSQSVASTLSTHWFYDRSACGAGDTSPSYVQIGGGATLLYADAPSDALFLRLNNTPPAGAVLAGWDATAVTAGSAMTAIHHPAGDWKKVSLGNIAGFSFLGSPYPTGSFIAAQWSLGATEPGSSGSGIFTPVGQPATDYRFRGGLWGGSSSCEQPTLKDFYSRLDQVYPSISRYLSPAATTSTLSVTRSGAGNGTVTSTPAGISCGATCSATFASGAVVALAAVPDAGSVFGGWSGACTGTGSCQVTLSAAASVGAAFALVTPAPAVLTISDTRVDFGNQLVKTTSGARSVTLTNSGATTIAFTGLAAAAPFAVTHDCSTLTAGRFCTAIVTFTPAAAGAGSGALTVTSNVATRTVALAGVGQESPVARFYASILRRAPDAAGQAFWDNEALRLASVGTNVNEAWYAMAMAFFGSPEYRAFGRDDAGFVTDLYNTFFARPPDGAGLAFWSDLIASGLPREVALAGFMFSSEFTTSTQALYGNATVRPEIDAVTDFYRGLLARLPDSAGYNFWLQRFRTAQCQGAGAVYEQAESISSAFADGPEYAARGRTHAQFVGDLYNAFLRRGGDLAGVRFWIGQLDSGAQTRGQLRQAFLASPEFSARVAAIIARGCITR
jgi:hypothetical protein